MNCTKTEFSLTIFKELQIWWSFEDTSELVFLISEGKHYVETPHLNCLDEIALITTNVFMEKLTLDCIFIAFYYLEHVIQTEM